MIAFSAPPQHHAYGRALDMAPDSPVCATRAMPQTMESNLAVA